MRLDTQKKPCSKALLVVIFAFNILYGTFCIYYVSDLKLFLSRFQRELKEIYGEGTELMLKIRLGLNCLQHYQMQMRAGKDILWVIPQVNNSLPLPCPK